MRAQNWLMLLVLVVSGPAAAAPIYPWCTTGAGHEFGARNCGFVTFEQCMQTARGNGQMCQQNPDYLDQAKPAPRAKRRSGAHTTASH